MNNELMDKIKSGQATIDILLKAGEIFLSGARERLEAYEFKKWKIEIIRDDGEYTLGMATADTADGIFPDHVHCGVVEYLICIRGSFLEMFGPNGSMGSRIVREGECVAIKDGMTHSSRPLVPGTRMVFICVPADKGMTDLVKLNSQCEGLTNV